MSAVDAARRARLALRRRRHLRRLAAPKLIAAFADAYPEAFFVEIGANDGEQHDHLRPFVLEGEWRGIMVEPVPYVFERLRRNLGGLGRVALENVAIAGRDGTVTFHHLAEAAPGERARLPSWYDAIGSLSRDAVAAHAAEIPDVERRIVSAEVPSLTFESLLHRHGDPRVDLLLIDAEGHDWSILQTVDFDAQRPLLVAYEHYHLAAAERSDCRGHLESLGYRAMPEGFDTFCLHERAAPALIETFERLEPGVPEQNAEDAAP